MKKTRVQVLAVTGGAQGIGRAVARHFAKAGYAVSIADTNARAGRETLRSVRALGAAAAFFSKGAIINIASTRAFMSEPGTEAYSASKGGIVALTHATAISLARRGIRVNCISPGWIETRGRRHSRRDRLQHPVGRVGTPQDVARACLFLAAGADFMTGQNLTLDGGMSVKMIYED